MAAVLTATNPPVISTSGVGGRSAPRATDIAAMARRERGADQQERVVAGIGEGRGHQTPHQAESDQVAGDGEEALELVLERDGQEDDADDERDSPS